MSYRHKARYQHGSIRTGSNSEPNLYEGNSKEVKNNNGHVSFNQSLDGDKLVDKSELKTSSNHRFNRNNHTCASSNMCDITFLYGDLLLPSACACFNKKYHFELLECTLPGEDKIFADDKWQVHWLQTSKARLNAVKDKLNEFNLKQWHDHTRFTNPAAYVVHFLKKDIQAEFLTQAWCKFYEIANSYLIISSDTISNNDLVSVHLCEAPGAFIASLNHYLKVNHTDIAWGWMANTLNPFYEGNSLSAMINDDRFILNTLDNWDFGRFMTGDIFDMEYVSHLLHELCLRKHNKANLRLVTADGSIDCQDNPGEQEIRVTSLLFAESLVALKILSKGGTFILKIFTLFECDTICLLYLLCCTFTEINLFKPCTSKEGNSECYIVCIGYKGIYGTTDLLNKIHSGIDGCNLRNDKAVFPLSVIPQWFIEEVTQCSDFFTDIQISVIERNIRLFKHPDGYPCKNVVTELQNLVFNMYVEKYNVRSIPQTDYIIQQLKILNDISIIEPRVAIVGSFSDKKKKRDRNAGMRIEEISSQLTIAVKTAGTENISYSDILYKNNLVDQEIITFKPMLGTAITGIVSSSQFCYGGFIRLKNELLKLWIPTECPTRLRADVLPSFDEPNIVICDVGDVYNGYENNNIAQHISFLRILRSLRRFVFDGSTLIIDGLPLLTHFNVSLIYILRYVFEYVSYEKPSCIIFHNCTCNQSIITYLVTIKDFLDLLRKTRLGLLYFVPIQLLRENEFYKWVVYINHISFERELRNMIDDVQMQIKN